MTFLRGFFVTLKIAEKIIMSSSKIKKYLLFLSFMSVLFLNSLKAQTFADKRYYLVDSLELNELSNNEKKLIDSSLVDFYATKQDTAKAKIINSLIVYLPNEKVWSKYNNWLYDFTTERLRDSFKIHPKKQRLLLNIKALVLNTKGYMYNERSEKDKALAAYAESLELLKKIGDKENTAAVLNNIGGINRSKGEISKALTYFQESLKIRESINDKKGMAYVLNNIGLIYRNSGDNTKGLEYYFRSLSILEEINDKQGEVALLNNLGGVYQSQGDYHQAIKYHKKSLSIKEELGDKKGIAISLTRLGSIYYKQGDTKAALSNYYKSLTIQKEVNDKEGIATSLNLLGKLFIKSNGEKALTYFDESLEINRQIEDKEGIAIALNNIALSYLELDKVSKAKTNGLESLRLAQELMYPIRIKQAAETLNKIYVKEKKWKKAYEMKSLSVTMRDSLRSIETEKNAIKQQSKYELGKKEQEITLLLTQNNVLHKDKEVQRLRISKNRIVIILISIALVLALVLSAAINKGNKRKKTIYKLLQKQKEEITIKNDEKTAMLQEIHHRVKNNLQIVNSLLKFQSREIEDKNVLQIFEKAQKRVVSMALLHEKMYNSDDLKHVDVEEYISLLISDLIETYSVGKKIKQNIQVDNVHFEMRTLVPLGLIINEIITNSFKHAFIDTLEGEIKIDIKQLENGSYEMLIGDDGIGSINSKYSGIGNKLIHIFVKQLNGTITLLKQSGTVYKIVFEEID